MSKIQARLWCSTRVYTSHSVSTLLHHPPTSILEVAMERTDLREESRFRDARTIPVVQKISKVTNSKLTSHNVTHLYVWLLSMTSLSSRRPVLSIAIASRNAISRRTNDPCSKENIKSHELENQKSRCGWFICVTSWYIRISKRASNLYESASNIHKRSMLQVCCSVLQGTAGCCRVLQGVADIRKRASNIH